jgi:hypothetical protein
MIGRRSELPVSVIEVLPHGAMMVGSKESSCCGGDIIDGLRLV